MYLTNQYDANGRVSRQTLVDTGVWLYSYTLDAQGKVKSSEVTDPRGLVIKKAFNTDGYVLTDTFISGHDQLKLTFDRQAGTNLITRVTDALSRKTDYGHDACGNVTSVTRMAGTSQAATTSYTYQTASDCLATYNRLTGVTDPLNHTTGIGYDAAGNLTSIQGPIPSIPATTFGYNTAGQVTSVTNPLSKTWQFGYEYGDLNTVTDPLQRTTTRVTDYAGRLGMMENALGQRTHLEYDVLNRLRKITDPLTGKTEFTYDPNGNLLSVKDARSGTTGYAYDDNGNLTGDGVNTYTWDARDRLVSMTGANFQYDPFGRRIGKTTGGTTTQFLYDGVNPLQEIAGTTTGLLTGLGIDQVLTRTDSSGTRHLLTDALGSTVALVDPSGLVQTQYTYEPFGKVSAGGTASGNPFQYTGRENDGTGLYYYRARYYHPGLQRFISEDPARLAGGDLNFYSYTFNSPTNFFDPTGLDPLTRLWGGVRALGGGFEAFSGYGLAAATAWTGIGTLAGGAVGLHGLDQVQAGLRQLASGCRVDSLTSLTLQGAGLSQATANLVDAGASMAGSLGTGIATQGIRAGGLHNIMYYEAGQSTMSASEYATYAKYTDPVQRGMQRVADQGWIKSLFSGFGAPSQFSKTIPRGVTPILGGSIGSAGGAANLLGGGCGCAH